MDLQHAADIGRDHYLNGRSDGADVIHLGVKDLHGKLILCDVVGSRTPATLVPMREFDNLFEVFSWKYLKCDSPLTVQSYKDRDENLRQVYLAVATRVLGGASPGTRAT